MTDKTKTGPGSARKTTHGRSKPVVKENKLSLSEAIASEVEKSEVVLMAKRITGKLQDMLESLPKLESSDIMPMLELVRTSFGPETADRFNQVATAQVRDLITAIQTAKNGMDAEISRMETIVNGGDPSDAAMDASMAPPPEAAPGAPDPMAGGEPAGDMPAPPSMPSTSDIDAAGVSGFAGRARKEGAKPKGHKLNEFADNAADGLDFKAHMDTLAAMSPKCAKLADEIRGRIHDLPVGGEIRNKLMLSLGHVLSMASTEGVWGDPGAVADMGVSTHFVDGPMAQVARTAEVKTIITDLHKLSHMIGMKHEGHLNEDDMMAPAPVAPAPGPAPASPLAAGPVFESRRLRQNAKRLREAHNPDRMILTVFRKVFHECRNVAAAVQGTARAFGIDSSDVVMIIREAKSRIGEAMGPTLMGVEMGKPDAINQTMASQQAIKPTAATPEPGKPNKPMSPSDMRSAQQTRQAQEKVAAANNMPNQPIAPPRANVPVTPVKPGQQIKPVAQQPDALVRNKLPSMPGKLATTANIRA